MTSRGEWDIWPSLVEKAYLKLMGGYDFPGSNSSTDIHALAGWIPDYLEVKSPSFQREQLWSRLSRGFNDGQCILTVGTDVRPLADRGRVKLLPSHCYPVIDVKETEDGSRWLTILDSWLPTDNGTEVDALLDELSLDGEDDNQRRSIDIAWDDACTLFGCVSVSWNPVMFKNQLIYHGVWKAAHLSPARRDESVHQTLRIRLEGTKDAERPFEEVWILLTRHRTDTRRSSEFISLHAEYDDGHPEARKNITDSAKTQGIYTDNPHVLVRVTVPSPNASGTISLNLSYDGSFDGVGFTAIAYSGLGMHWDGPLRALLFDLRISGTLTTKTSGGNYTLPSYMINPQYRIRVPATTQDGPSGKTRIEASLHAPRDVPVNVMATWGRGERVFEWAYPPYMRGDTRFLTFERAAWRRAIS
jgi:calpain-7